MVEIRWYPAVRCMAVVTGVRGAYVSRILAYSSCSVMAAKACACYSGMVKISRCPSVSRMTIVTSIGACNMSWYFACRSSTVMAVIACTIDRSVIDLNDR
jgi:hypothetical protein